MGGGYFVISLISCPIKSLPIRRGQSALMSASFLCIERITHTEYGLAELELASNKSSLPGMCMFESSSHGHCGLFVPKTR